MKKYLALVLGVLFVLSFAASAFAIHAEIPSETQAVVAKSDIQITLGGEIRIRGWMKDNIGDGFAFVKDEPWHGREYELPDGTSMSKFGVKTPVNSYYDERVRLSLDAQVTPNVRGFVMLESGWDGHDVYVWGDEMANSKPSNGTLNINEAWILYTGSGLFGFNSGIKIGHMPLALGERQFFDHTKYGDDAIVVFMDPTKELHMGLLTIKLKENASVLTGDPQDGNSADADAYVALATYKIDDKNTVGINYTYINQSSDETGTTLVGDRLKFQDLGVHANGNISGLGYKAEGDIQFGSVGESGNKADFKGYGVMLGVNYNVNPVNLRASFALGSGDNNDNNKIDTFQTFLTSMDPNSSRSADQHYTLVYEYQAASTALNTGTGIANTTYFNLGLDYNATKELGFGLDGYILRATKTFSGISHSAGWEVDGKMTYQIAKNLTYQIDAGYFKPGSFYKDLEKAAGENRWWWEDSDEIGTASIKGITVLRHMITLSF